MRIFCKNGKGKLYYKIILLYSFFSCFLLVNCSKSTQPNLENKIMSKGKIIMETDQVQINPHFFINTESDYFIIDWGDGNKELTKRYPGGNFFNKKYNEEKIHTITIYGAVIILWVDNMELLKLDVTNCRSLRSLVCSNNNLTELDVSNCRNLMELYCYLNELSSLDVRNTFYLNKLDIRDNKLKNLNLIGLEALRWIWCQNNYFEASELNNMFKALKSGYLTRMIFLHNNPGTSECDASIAIEKKWLVNTDTPSVYPK